MQIDIAQNKQDGSPERQAGIKRKEADDPVLNPPEAAETTLQQPVKKAKEEKQSVPRSGWIKSNRDRATAKEMFPWMSI